MEPTTQRYKLTLAYRGSNYHGWQSQAVTENYKSPVPAGQGIPTIQETVARAIGSVVIIRCSWWARPARTPAYTRWRR